MQSILWMKLFGPHVLPPLLQYIFWVSYLIIVPNMFFLKKIEKCHKHEKIKSVDNPSKIVSVLRKCPFSHLDYNEWTSMEKLKFSGSLWWSTLELYIHNYPFRCNIPFKFVHKSFLDMNSMAPFPYFPSLFFLRGFLETLLNFGIWLASQPLADL